MKTLIQSVWILICFLTDMMCIQPTRSQMLESVIFNKELISVKFDPVNKLGNFVNDVYTDDDVESMLELVSSKFTSIHTLSIGAFTNSPNKNELNAYRKTPLAAARLNKRLKRLEIKVNLGIEINGSKTDKREINEAARAINESNNIFPGTVESIVFHLNGPDSHLALASRIRFFLSKTARFPALPIGVRPYLCRFMSYFSPFLDQISKASNADIRNKLNYMICFIYPRAVENKMPIARGYFSLGIIEDMSNYILRIKKELALKEISMKIVIETGWPSNGLRFNGLVSSVENMKKFWLALNEYSVEQNQEICMMSAFDKRELLKDDNIKLKYSYRAYYGWWERTEDEKSSPEAFIEKVLDVKLQAHHPSPDGKSYFEVILVGVFLILLFIACLLGVKIGFNQRQSTLQQSLLSKKEVEEFCNGVSSHHNPNTSGKFTVEEALKVPYDRTFEIAKSDVSIDYKEILGSGKFGVVFKAMWISKNRNVAAKTFLSHESATNLMSLLSEIKIMIYIGKHPHVVEIFGAYTAEIIIGKVFLITELCENGSLESYLMKMANEINCKTNENKSFGGINHMKPTRRVEGFKRLTKWSLEIASGMDYIASKRVCEIPEKPPFVIHGDLATRNVLLSSTLEAKITDFGLSRRLFEYTQYTKKGEEPLPWRWMAPESLEYSKFSTKSDAWSFGVTLWEIFSIGETPYSGLNWTTNFAKSLRNGLRLYQPEHCTNSLYRVISECWSSNPLNRPDFSDLKTLLSTISQDVNINLDYVSVLNSSEKESDE